MFKRFCTLKLIHSTTADAYISYIAYSCKYNCEVMWRNVANDLHLLYAVNNCASTAYLLKGWMVILRNRNYSCVRRLYITDTYKIWWSIDYHLKQSILISYDEYDFVTIRFFELPWFSTHRGRVPSRLIKKYHHWFRWCHIRCLVPNYCLGQSWRIVNWTVRENLCNLNQNTIIGIQ